MQRWFPDFFNRFGTLTVFDLLDDYIRSGRIQLDRSKLTQRIAYHDPCNYGRKSEALFGHGFFEEPRWVLNQCTDHWIDLYPSGNNQYCCGGGGGTLLTPYKETRFHYGRRKMEQVKRADVEMIVLPCHSCHGQIKALLAEHQMDHIAVKYLWEVVADILVFNKPSESSGETG